MLKLASATAKSSHCRCTLVCQNVSGCWILNFDTNYKSNSDYLGTIYHIAAVNLAQDLTVPYKLLYLSEVN